MNNPMELNLTEIRLLSHMLGGKDPKKWYRNHFVASDNHFEMDDLKSMERRGLIEQDPNWKSWHGKSVLFFVTCTGKKSLSETLSIKSKK